eukprot:3502670-Prymnesium_polylepis.1
MPPLFATPALPAPFFAAPFLPTVAARVPQICMPYASAHDGRSDGSGIVTPPRLAAATADPA